MSKSTISDIKRLWQMMAVPQRVEWCTEAGISGKKGSLEVPQLDTDMIESLSQVAIIVEKGDVKMVTKNNKKETENQETQEAIIETPEGEEVVIEEPEAQETTPEANKAKTKDVFAGKTKKEPKVKKTKAERQAELGKKMKEGKPKAEKKTEEKKVTKKDKPEKKSEKVEAKVEKVETTEKPTNASRAWAEATKSARFNMCASVGVIKNRDAFDWADLSKEEKLKIAAGDMSILTYKGEKGKKTRADGGAEKAPKISKAPKTGGDLVGGGMDIKLKNIKDFGGGAILAKGVDGKGTEYVVFMALKKS